MQIVEKVHGAAIAQFCTSGPLESRALFWDHDEERIMDAMNREATELEEDLGQGGNLKSKFNRGAEKAKEFASKASEKASEYAGIAKEKATEYAGKAKDATESKIREYPLWSMAVAMGVGMAIGLAVSAMFSRKNEMEY